MLEEQLKNQKTTFKLPHLEHAMVNEAELKAGKGLKEVFVTSLTEMVGGRRCRMGWQRQMRQGSEVVWVYDLGWVRWCCKMS